MESIPIVNPNHSSSTSENELSARNATEQEMAAANAFAIEDLDIERLETSVVLKSKAKGGIPAIAKFTFNYASEEDADAFVSFLNQQLEEA